MRLLPGLLLFALLFAAISVAVPVGVQGQENPVLVLSNFVMKPAYIPPGGTAVANFTVKNENLAQVYGATIAFTANLPLTIVGTGSTFYIGDMNGNTSFTFSATIGATPSAPPGNYIMPYVLTYNNGTNGLSKEVLSSKGQVNIPVGVPGQENPVLVLSNFVMKPAAIPPGGTAVANFTVKNENLAQVYRATIAFTAMTPLSIVGSGSILYIGNMNGNSVQTFQIRVGASPNAKLGSFSLPYNITYYDASNVLRFSPGLAYITISGTPAKPQLVVSSIAFPSGAIIPGSGFGTAINVTNTGSEVAYISTLTLSPQKDVVVSGGTGVFAIGSLGVNQSRIVNVQMTVSSTAPSESVPVSYSLDYNDKFGLSYSLNGTYFVRVTATPDVKVGAFSLSVAPLRPGTNGFLTLTMLNVGGDRAYDVKLSLAGSPLLATAETNYLGAIQSGGQATASFYLSVSNSTVPGNYLLALDVSYSDISGKAYTSLNNYTIPVESYVTPSVTVTSTVIDPPVLSTGAQGTITIFLKNTGATEARGVTIHVQGGTGILTSSYFGVGTMEPGDSITEIVGINIASSLRPGTYTLSFVVSYADATGQSFQTAVPLETTIYESVNVFTLFNIAVIVGIVLLALAVFVILRRSKVI